MLGLDKNTVENLLIILSSVLIFNGITSMPVIGKYLTQNPMYIVIAGILLLVLSGKIADSVSFLDRQVTMGFLFIVAGVLLFHGLVNIPQVAVYFTTQPFIIVGIAFILLIFKDKIAGGIGGK